MHSQILRIIILNDTAISRELAEAKIHVNLTSAKSRFKRLRNSAKSSSRKNGKNIRRKNCGRDESTSDLTFFLRAIVLEQKDNGGFFSRRRNRARLSWTGGCGFFFISFFYLSIRKIQFYYDGCTLGKLTSSRSLGLFRVCVGDQLFSYL